MFILRVPKILKQKNTGLNSVSYVTLTYTMTFLMPWGKSLLKKLLENYKLLVTSIFSFSYVFYPIQEMLHHLIHNELVICKCFQYEQSYGFVVYSGIITIFLVYWTHNLLPFQSRGTNSCQQAISENAFKMDMSKVLSSDLTLAQTSPGFYVHNERFLLFLQCFLPVWITSCHFHRIWNFCLQTVWKSLIFVVW